MSFPSKANLHLTIGIATWNRAALLSRTLESLARVRLPPGLTREVVVCDNNSSDDTPAILSAAASQFPGVLRPLFEPNQGKSHALNQILGQATGQWVLLIDDDVLVDSDWIEGYARGIAHYPDAVCLGGAIEPDVAGPCSRRRRFLLQTYPGAFGVLAVPQDRPMHSPDTAWGANMALRRDCIPAQGFPTDRGLFGNHRIAGEDMRMMQIMLERGPGWLLAGVPVRHYLPAASISVARFRSGQMAVGRSWRGYREAPKPGRWGVAWWAWRHLAGRGLKALTRWRPWPTRPYFDALADACQWWGFLRG